MNSICISYYTQRQSLFSKREPYWLKLAKKGKLRVMADSGAFSFLIRAYNKRESEKEILKQIDSYLFGGQSNPFGYVSWIHSYSHLLDFYITFDYRISCSLIYAMTERLNKAGICPVPVYHGDSSGDWLRRYAEEGHKLIAVSDSYFMHEKIKLRRFLDQVFSLGTKLGLNYHGLGITGNEMWEYPWYSVDSTSWRKVAGFGNILVPQGYRLVSFPVSEENPKTIVKESAGILEKVLHGRFSIDVLRKSFNARMCFNALMLKEFTERRKGVSCLKKATLF
jgi:hypothetical protein